MANYVIGDNKCFKEAYTKEELDNGTAVVKAAQTVPWGGIKDKPEFAIVKGNVNVVDGIGSTRLNYPSGFNKDNCVIVSGATYYNNQWCYYQTYGNPNSMKLGTSGIDFGFHGIQGASLSAQVKIVLMKI